MDRQAGQPEFNRPISDFFNTTYWVSCLSLLVQVCMPPVGEEGEEEDLAVVGAVGEVPLRVRSGFKPNRLEGSRRSKPRGGNGGDAFSSDAGVGGGGSGGFIFVLYKTTTAGFDLNTSTSVAGGSNGAVGNTTNATTAQAGNKGRKQIT